MVEYSNSDAEHKAQEVRMTMRKHPMLKFRANKPTYNIQFDEEKKNKPSA